MNPLLNLSIADIMNRSVRHVAPDCTLNEAAQQMAEARISSLLVMSDKAPLGIITERDMLRLLSTHVAKETPVSEIMSAPVRTVPSGTEFGAAYSMALNDHIRHLVVVDEQGSVIGLASETDFRRHLSMDVLRQLDDVEGIMDWELPMLPPDETLDTALKLMLRDHTSYILVVEDHRPAGILTERDIPGLLAGMSDEHTESIPLREVMHSPVQTVSHRTSVVVAANLMQEMHFRHMVVVDDDGEVLGMVTLHNLLERISAFLMHEKTAHLKSSKQLSDERLNLAVEASNLGFWELDLVSKKLHYSDTLLKELGFCSDDAPTSLAEWMDCIHPDDRTLVMSSYQAALKQGNPMIDFECRVSSKENPCLWMHTRGRVVQLDNAGRPKLAMGTAMNISKRKAAEQEIEHLAFYDPITRLPNRRLLLDRLKQALASSLRNGREGALLLIDLDHFKTLNDTLGHDMGDLLLQQVARRLSSCIREGDTVARFGGDEFVVMLEDLSEQPLEAAAQIDAVSEKIIALLSQPYQLDAHEYRSTPSIGATLFDGHQQAIEELLKQAEIAMYQAKKTGRNTLRFFDPQMQTSITARANLEEELHKALAGRQFHLHYQIQVDNLLQPLGAEALIRWLHPERGLLSPAQFIPLSEETGLIHAIGLWVLDTACAQLKAWQKESFTRDLVLAVNVSAKQFRQPDFMAQVQAAIQRHAIDPMLLKLELTESLMLESIEETIATMKALNGIGVQFSLDDFGTGYSSLQYLKRLPLDQLKIDRTFVCDLPVDSSDNAIVRTIIAMAKSLNLDVIAEGVETEAQQQRLMKKGCTRYQGYLFGKPAPIEQFEMLLRKV